MTPASHRKWFKSSCDRDIYLGKNMVYLGKNMVWENWDNEGWLRGVDRYGVGVMKWLFGVILLTILSRGGLLAHPGGDHEHYPAYARDARAEAAKLLQQSMTMALESFLGGKESVESVLHHQRLLLEAERPKEMPPIERLLLLQKHVGYAERVQGWLDLLNGAGAAKLQDVLVARANLALRNADYQDGLDAANVKTVEVMKASIKAGDLEEFRFDQVEEWKGKGLEDLEGTPYLTGIAAYKPDTSFGPRLVHAKAYIKDDKVVKWVHARTGIEIKQPAG
jgi:hypothetical protein